jgi:hypothetical protein
MAELEGKPRTYKLYAEGKKYTVIQVGTRLYHSVRKAFRGHWDGIILRGEYLKELPEPEPSLLRPTQGRRKRADGIAMEN